VFSGIGHADAETLTDAIGGIGVEHGSAANLGNAAEDTDGKRCSKDSGVMVVDLVAESSGSLLIEPLELIKADRVAVRHNEPMEGECQTLLSETVNLAGFSDDLGARGNEQVLTISRIDIVRKKTAGRSGESAVEAVDQQGL